MYYFTKRPPAINRSCAYVTYINTTAHRCLTGKFVGKEQRESFADDKGYGC